MKISLPLGHVDTRADGSFRVVVTSADGVVLCEAERDSESAAHALLQRELAWRTEALEGFPGFWETNGIAEFTALMSMSHANRPLTHNTDEFSFEVRQVDDAWEARIYLGSLDYDDQPVVLTHRFDTWATAVGFALWCESTLV